MHIVIHIPFMLGSLIIENTCQENACNSIKAFFSLNLTLKTSTLRPYFNKGSGRENEFGSHVHFKHQPKSNVLAVCS